jgi:uncharacterized sulfatase
LHPVKIEDSVSHPIAEGLEQQLRAWLNDMNDPFLL